MKILSVSALLLFFCACSNEPLPENNELVSSKSDSLKIASMIDEREKAMIGKDFPTAMSQFAEDATWINSQGYYFEGKNEVVNFHRMLTGNDTLDYYYEAGEPKIRLIDGENALAYYSWKMFWYKKENPVDTTFKEIGLMTLTAHKINDRWKWVAVTNQHTPWFSGKIEAVKMD